MLPHFRILISKEPSFLAVSEALQQHLGMLQSLFYINNETFNMWSHIMVCFYFIVQYSVVLSIELGSSSSPKQDFYYPMLPSAIRILISKEPSFLAVSEALQQHLGMLQSLFYINNETFNMWSHIMVCFYFIVQYSVVLSIELGSSSSPKQDFYYPMLPSAIRSITICALSATAHTFNS